MFGLFGKKKVRDDGSVVAGDPNGDTRIEGRYACDDRDVITQTPDAIRIAEDILDVAASKAKDKLVGSKIEVSLLSMHPQVHHQEVSFALMMRAPDRGLSFGLNCNNKYTFIKV